MGDTFVKEITSLIALAIIYSDLLRSLESQHKDARNPNQALRNNFVVYAFYSMSCNCL